VVETQVPLVECLLDIQARLTGIKQNIIEKNAFLHNRSFITKYLLEITCNISY
jgi:hypothetical protein